MEYINQKELRRVTGLRNSQIDYLVREEIIPCIKNGRSVPRKFPLEAVEIIKAKLQKLNVSE